ncbi:MAG: aminoacyl-tRNA hydrolase [Lachnospiraceae bacterium]|jgi:PTH1 family peptidyl-tRNA hydrolase|nr:aminoacyl-tRNA hydrolase [Lachnospiraceae bacterium]
MYLIAGLGNPGRQYEGTRHNMGFDTIDRLMDEYHIASGGVRMKAMYGKGMIGGEKAILIKPVTYMNLSGEAVSAWLNYYKLDPESDLIVIYDDIDQDPGQLRIRAKGSAGGHNGMKSVISQIGTDRFVRIRIGVGAKPAGWDLADYVLGRFDRETRNVIDDAIIRAAEAVRMITDGDLSGAMTEYNRHKEIEK